MSVAVSRPPVRVWPLFLVTGLAGFMTTLDNTVVTVALPSVQRDLGARLTTLEWVATGYILTFSCLMLAGGRLADVWGHRRVLLAGLGTFTAAAVGVIVHAAGDFATGYAVGLLAAAGLVLAGALVSLASLP